MIRKFGMCDFNKDSARKLEEERCLTSAAEEFGINKSVVSRAWEVFQTVGTAVRKVGSSHPRKTTAVEDRYIVLKRPLWGPEVVVWGGIMLNGWIELNVFDRCSETGDRNCKEVILPHVRLFRSAIGPDFIFMDDNTWPQQTADVQQLLECEDIARMD
ncbi:transposable element Tcb2 transposase [Trichonephila clavipes]|nr:transposable element Tcb2 transposase [Trichonephila clavipes]